MAVKNFLGFDTTDFTEMDNLLDAAEKSVGTYPYRTVIGFDNDTGNELEVTLNIARTNADDIYVYVNDNLETIVPKGLTVFYQATTVNLTLPENSGTIKLAWGKFNFNSYLLGSSTNNAIVTSIDLGKNYGTEIGANAFYNCTRLTEIEIPSSVTSIGNNAFMNDTAIQKAITPSINDWLNISFASSSANPTYYTGSNLYVGDSKVVDLVIPNNVSTINSYTFYNCTEIKTVTMSESVTQINNDAFANCSGISYTYYTSTLENWLSITFGNTNSNPASKSKNLYINGTLLTQVSIPSTITKVNGYAFNLNKAITNLTVTNNTTEIGTYAFYGCSAITSISLGSGLTKVGTFAFYGCTGISTIAIPSSVTNIGASAFYGCTGLTTIDIPASVTTLGQSAFRNCTGLRTAYLRFVSANTKCNTNPNGTLVFSYPWFYGCSSSLVLYIRSSVTNPTSTFGTYWRYYGKTAQLTYYSTLS